MSDVTSPTSLDPEFADIDSFPHDPIMKAEGSPVSSRLVLLVAGIVVVVVAVTAIFAFSQGVLSLSGS